MGGEFEYGSWMVTASAAMRNKMAAQWRVSSDRTTTKRSLTSINLLRTPCRCKPSS